MTLPGRKVIYSRIGTFIKYQENIKPYCGMSLWELTCMSLFIYTLRKEGAM
jgi:hypothetical protein